MSLHAIEPTRSRGQYRVDGVAGPVIGDSSRRRSHGNDVAAMVWGAQNLISTQVKAYDSRCMRKHDIESYRASHILWHFQMPVAFILYNIYRVWKACGEIW